MMSGFVAAPGNPLSRITAASLGDLGYKVDLRAAEPYVLPNLMELAEAGSLVAHAAPRRSTEASCSRSFRSPCPLTA
jgi:hypothetical protein